MKPATLSAKSTIIALALLATALGAALPPAAQAQQQQAGAQARAQILEEIVVTAQKREQSLREVAASISVVGGETIRELDLLTFEDLERVTSGLQLIRQNPRNVTISNRGVFFDPESGSPASVDVYQNGVVQRADNMFGALYDIERVEILRGPQGSLQGATSPAGAIIVNTARPNLETYDGYLQTSLHDLGYNAQGALSVPLSPGRLGMRLAFYEDQNDQSDITNLRTGRTQDADTRSYRASLSLVAGEMTFDASYQSLDQLLYGTPQLEGARNGIARVFPNPLLPETLPCAVATGQPFADRCPQSFDPDDDSAYAAADMFGDREADIYTLNVKWDISDEHSMTYLYGYTDSVKGARTENDLSSNLELQNLYYENVIMADYTMNPMMPTPYRGDTDYLTHQTTSTAVETTIHEIRFASHDRPVWNYMYGLYFSDQETTTDFTAASTAARYIPICAAQLNVDGMGRPPSHPQFNSDPETANPLAFADLPAPMGTQGSCPSLDPMNPAARGNPAAFIEGINLITAGSIPVNQENVAFFTAHSIKLHDAVTLEVALRYQETEGFRTNDIMSDGLHQEGNISFVSHTGLLGATRAAIPIPMTMLSVPAGQRFDPASIQALEQMATQMNPVPGIQAMVLRGALARVEADTLAGTKAGVEQGAKITGIPLEHQKPKDDAMTGTLAVRWDINDELTGFASYNRSYRVGGISVNPGDNPGIDNQLYDAEESNAYEFGIKALLGQRAEINAVLYYQAFDGYQGFVRELRYVGPDPATRGATQAEQLLSGGLVFNGDMLSTGLDVDWRWLALDGLTLGGSFNWNQSEFDGAEVPCNVRDRDPMTGQIINIAAAPAVVYCEFDGDRIPGSPELQASFFIEYVANLGGSQFFIRSNTKHSSGILATRAVEFGSDPGETDAYLLSDLFLGFRSLADTWEISLYAKNLTDDRADLDLRNPGGGSGTSGNFDPVGYFTELTRLPPASYGLRLNYTF